MATDKTLGSLFGKAKKWVEQEVKNATKIGGDPREHDAEREASADLRREIERDAHDLAQQQAIEAALPQSVKDYRDRADAAREQRRADGDARARAERLARATDATVTLRGAISGTADGLAVDVTLIEPEGHLAVLVETIDPVQMDGGLVSGFCFLIPTYDGDGRYELTDHPEFDALQYELYLAEESEGWAFHPTHGPGVIVVTDGVADVRLTVGGVGVDTIALHASVPLGSLA